MIGVMLSMAEGLEQLTLGRLLALFHRFEVDGGHGTDHLHGFSFHQTGVLLVPTSSLKIQSSDVYSILEGGQAMEGRELADEQGRKGRQQV